MNLEEIGFDSFFREKFSHYLSECNNKLINHIKPARVLAVFRNQCKLMTDIGELDGIISRKVIDNYSGINISPSVGDWVVISFEKKNTKAVILEVLSRKKNKFSRNFFERKRKNISVNEQVLASNIDIIFLVLALNMDFNLRRLERYLVALSDSNINPVILLNKSDLCDMPDEKLKIVTEESNGIPVFVISTLKKRRD